MTMCSVTPNSTITDVLNRACNYSECGKLHHPITSLLYIATAVVSIVLILVTHFRYNSVTVLNLTVRTKSISNIPWIFYFSALGVRTLISGIIYGITRDHSHHTQRLQVYFTADAVLKSLEILFLAWALNHQRKYRAGGFLQQEISSFNSGDLRQGTQDLLSFLTAKLLKVETLIGTLFFLSIIFLTMHETISDKPFYWIYLVFLWMQCIGVIAFLVVVVYKRNDDGPHLYLKVLLVVGVLLILPAVIPSYVWSSCFKCTCARFKDVFTCYDVAIFLSLPATIIFFIALRWEFLRLDQEAQYSVVGEVESLFSVHSHSQSL